MSYGREGNGAEGLHFNCTLMRRGGSVYGQKKSESDFHALLERKESKRKHNTAAHFQGLMCDGGMVNRSEKVGIDFQMNPSATEP